ncbi:hypothetical protein [Domibacillus indicus]|uniref:hypothetical protein n=1 Tax=Domibacillus indicus TaxID=1437523 RepID=UPI000617C1CB|nr:hypothetical protein [Domibacillus indicus]
MIYVNGQLVTTSKNKIERNDNLKTFLYKEKLVIIDDTNVPVSSSGINAICDNSEEIYHLKAIKTNSILRDFKEELAVYINKVTHFVDETRETENYSSVPNAFIQVAEALIEFNKVADYLQKELIDINSLNNLSEKALIQTESGNIEYVLDLIEYELLPILEVLLKETNEEI